MARARAIETRLEKLVPALDEYCSSGFLTREETVEVSRQRQHWEFRLVAKPLLLLDVRGAIKYELGLEKRLREYCMHTKLNLQHRWAIVDRIEAIYKIGLKHLKSKVEHEALRQECVLFLKQFQRNGSLSNLYGELMVMHPRRSDIWVEAAEWQGLSQRNTDNARAIVQQALLTMSSEPVVWACALRVELLFVQRLLDGLLADHREEARKARKRGEASAADGDEVPIKTVSAEEPTTAIAPKLRQENESMAHVLLDLALAKTVVEEAFNSPASGSALMEQLLAVAGAYAFSREVMKLIVMAAAQKMVQACCSSADETPDEARRRGERHTASSSSLTIASDQQRRRVHTQWRHRHSIDSVFANYLGLEDMLVNRYSTAIVDTEAYLADGGNEAGNRARQREQRPPQAQQAANLSSSFFAPTAMDRKRAAVKSIVCFLCFAAVPASVLSKVPNILAADIDSSERFPEVRHFLLEVLSRIAEFSSEGASAVCAQILQRMLPFACPSLSSTVDPDNKGKKRHVAKAPTQGMTVLMQPLLGMPKVDNATLQDCVIDSQRRVTTLVQELTKEAGMHPPAKTRARHEASDTAISCDPEKNGTQPLMTWSVLQLERFLQKEAKDALLKAADVAPTTALGTLQSMTLGAQQLQKSTQVTAEAVERLIVWWKEEEAQLQQPAPQRGTPSYPELVAASQGRRHRAVVELLCEHGLLPSTVMPDITPEGKRNGKRPLREGISAVEEEGWARTADFLLNRLTALQFVAADFTGSPRLPLSFWRVYSALETLEGPRWEGELRGFRKSANQSDGASSNEDDEEDDSDSDCDRATRIPSAGLPPTRLSSFAAAGLVFLSGVPTSTLTRDEEWLRLEGLTSLLRCRLASWLGRRVCTREVVADALRTASADVAEAWITDIQNLLSLAQRCQPLPRFAYIRCVLPFTDGVALFRSSSHSKPSANIAALKANNSVEIAQAARTAVQAARDAHETLLKLYTLSQHPESFLPLLYDGTSLKLLHQASSPLASVGKASTVAVQQSNTEDWVAYVQFERHVARDLLRAKTVVEQARRAALAPQSFMVELNCL